EDRRVELGDGVLAALGAGAWPNCGVPLGSPPDGSATIRHPCPCPHSRLRECDTGKRRRIVVCHGVGRATIPGVTTTARLYSALVRRDVESENELPDRVRRDVSRNGLRLVAANTLQSSGDQTVSASTVLPWLFHVLGVPAALIGLLVPIRETGSMLPQAFLTPLVVRVTYRKWVFVAG